MDTSVKYMVLRNGIVYGCLLYTSSKLWQCIEEPNSQALSFIIKEFLKQAIGAWEQRITAQVPVRLEPASYLLAAGAALIFALLVQLVTDRILDKIDMVQALKSVE